MTAREVTLSLICQSVLQQHTMRGALDGCVVLLFYLSISAAMITHSLVNSTGMTSRLPLVLVMARYPHRPHHIGVSLPQGVFPRTPPKRTSENSPSETVWKVVLRRYFATLARMRRPYQTDLSDAEWNNIEPHMLAPNRQGQPVFRRLTADDMACAVLRSGTSGLRASGTAPAKRGGAVGASKEPHKVARISVADAPADLLHRQIRL
jgi:hypothetical protein